MAATPGGIFSKAKKQWLQADIDLVGDSVKGALLNAATPDFTAAGWGGYADVSGELATANGYTAGGVSLAGKTLTLTDANSWATARAPSTAYVVGNIVKPASGNGFVYRCVVAGTTGADVVPTANTNASPSVLTANGNGLANGNAVTVAGVTTATAFNAALVVNAATTSTWDALLASTFAQVNAPGVGGWGSATIVPTWPTVIGQQITDGTVTWVCFASTVLSYAFTAPAWNITGAGITADALLIYKSGTGTGTSPIANPLVAVLPFGTTMVAAGGTLTVNLDATAFALDFGG